jgi:amidase
MDRRHFLRAAGAAAAATGAGGLARALAASAAPEDWALSDIASACADGRLSSRELTERYLARIETLDRQGPGLKAVLETNPRALEAAAALDEERTRSGPRGPLHGVPLLIKDNVETADRMMTTAGSLALEGWYAPEDAPLVARLRSAGAVILGKTNLSEWANFRSTRSLSGWSARGGQTRNPYALNRSPSGSSSGSAVAVAASLCAGAIGTETDGSIVSPASVNGVVGLKPTLGLVSRRGIVPISHVQDTAGPITRTVRDAALLLGVMAGADARDPASAAAAGHFGTDYLRALDPDGLQGARLGIARRFYVDNAPLERFLDDCVALLARAGVVLFDPAELPAQESEAELEALLYEFKADLNAYLARLPARFPARSIAELIRFNDANARRELALFDQELLHRADAKGSLEEKAYLVARAAALGAARDRGIDALLREQRLDAIVSLSSGPAWLIDVVNGDADSGSSTTPAAIAGYPHITVPAGLYRGLPVGLSFFGGAFSEPKLLRLAFGFEHVAAARRPPHFLPGV